MPKLSERARIQALEAKLTVSDSDVKRFALPLSEADDLQASGLPLFLS